MTFGSLFAGIGGFDLGFERAGMTCSWQVEIDPFCRRVLAKHWPEVPRHDDIRTFPDDTEARRVDVICGGFPCQPYSVAGKRRGAEDDRALWPEMLRVITTLRPAWVVGENVAGFANMGLDAAVSDMERAGYGVQVFDIPAIAVDARHERRRLWIVANADSAPSEGGWIPWGASEEVTIDGRGCRWEAEPGVDRVADGIPHRLDRLRSLGNAVVPQVAEQIGRAIIAANRTAPRAETLGAD